MGNTGFMNWADLLLIGIVLFGVWDGLRKGFILELLYLLGLIITIAATFFLYPYLTVFVNKYIPSLGARALPFAFIVTYVIMRVLTNALTNRILIDITTGAHSKGVTKVFGIFAGFLNGVMNAIIG